MFDIIFGWRKASKCKKLIKRVQCRLKLLKNKRHSIVKQLRKDVAQLIKLGYEETAFNRAEQLFKDESIMAVYDLLDHFCEFINIQLSYIRRNRDCPNDINEAVSSLIFASARCADLPELPAIRKLFGERYGQRFATAAVELLPGNLVNREIKEKLSIKSVSDDAKYRLVDEIARDFCLQPEILALEYIPEMQLQANEICGHQEHNRNDSKTEGSAKMQTSDANNIEGKSIQVDSLEMCAYTYPNSEAICTSLSSSQRPSPDKMEMEMEMESPGEGKSRSLSWICSTTSRHKDERIKAPSSSESLPKFSEEVIVYLDDIEELQSSMAKGDYQDWKLFKSPILPKRGAVVDGSEGSDEGYMEKSSSRTFSMSRNSHGTTRSRRRSLSLGSSNMKDTDHRIYYESYQNRKLPTKTTTVAESKESIYMLKKPKQPCCIQPNNFKYNTASSCCNCHINSELKTCSLENPCYNCTGYDSEEQFPPRNQKKGLRNSGQFPICDAVENLDDKFRHCECSSNGAANGEPGCNKANLTHNLRRSYDNGASENGVLNLPKLQQEKIVGKMKASDSAGSEVSSNGSLPSEASSQARKGTVPPYLRAMTMPKEMPREIQRYSVRRSNSLSFQNPNHVHPKLPEYDDLAAKFMALKKEHLLYKQ